MNRVSITFALLVALLAGGCKSEPTAVQESAPVADVTAAPADPSTLIRNGKMPLEGVLTGGQPTDEQLAALRDAGYKTVINLRQPDEKGIGDEPATVAALGMTYVSLPVAGAEGINEENAVALAAALDAAEGPVLLHCGSGNRVGALLAMKAFHVDGASAEEALELGLAGGVTRLEGTVREKLGLAE